MLLKAAETSQDKTWRLPLEDSYGESLESPVADIMNASADRSAGSIIGAYFLSQFTGSFRWAHLDVAGTAWISGKNRNATGRPVPLLVQWLQDLASHAH